MKCIKPNCTIEFYDNLEKPQITVRVDFDEAGEILNLHYDEEMLLSRVPQPHLLTKEDINRYGIELISEDQHLS